MDDDEEAAVQGVNGDAEDCGVWGKGGVRDEAFDDTSVGDGGDGALMEGAEKEVLG